MRSNDQQSSYWLWLHVGMKGYGGHVSIPWSLSETAMKGILSQPGLLQAVSHVLKAGPLATTLTSSLTPASSQISTQPGSTTCTVAQAASWGRFGLESNITQSPPTAETFWSPSIPQSIPSSSCPAPPRVIATLTPRIPTEASFTQAPGMDHRVLLWLTPLPQAQSHLCWPRAPSNTIFSIMLVTRG